MAAKMHRPTGPEPVAGPMPALPGERALFHRLLERWVGLQSFIYGLPEDFSYAIRVSGREGRCRSSTLVSVGSKSWFGSGQGPDRRSAVAAALGKGAEPLSSNRARVLFHRACSVFRILRRWPARLLARARRGSGGGGEERQRKEGKLLAG